LDWKWRLETVIPPAWQPNFIHDVLKAFRWLCPVEDIPDLWTLWELSNGGVFLAPVSPWKFRVNRSDRNFDELVQAETVGFLSTIFAVNWWLTEPDNMATSNPVMGLYKQLLRFRWVHPESAAICAVMD